MEKGQNYNHPEKGRSIKVDPIKDKKHIQTIKKLLADKPLDFCLFGCDFHRKFFFIVILSAAKNLSSYPLSAICYPLTLFVIRHFIRSPPSRSGLGNISLNVETASYK